MPNEIFLLVNDTFEQIATTVVTFGALDELNEQLAIDSYGDLEEDSARIYQGIMTSAAFLPKNFEALTPYVYIPNPLGISNVACADEAHFEKVKSDPEVVALLIEELITEKTFKFDNGNAEVVINDVRIFFGIELPKIFQVAEDHVDEEMVERVTKLVRSMDEINKKLEDGKYETQS